MDNQTLILICSAAIIAAFVIYIIPVPHPNPHPKPHPHPTPILDGYDFYPNTTYPGGDLSTDVKYNHQPDQLAAVCNANPQCVGFDSTGVLKQNIADKHFWGHLSISPLPQDGLYLKKADVHTVM